MGEEIEEALLNLFELCLETDVCGSSARFNEGVTGFKMGVFDQFGREV